MIEDLKAQIFRELDTRDTDDLLRIWQTNDRVDWSDEAFEAIREILQKRLGELPPQSAPITVREALSSQDDHLEDWEEALLNDENQPDLYDVIEVLTLKRRVDILAVAVIVVNVLLGLLRVQFIRGILSGVLPSAASMGQALPELFGMVVGVGLNIAVLYFPLKMLVQILRILMQMEFNSRKTNTVPLLSEN